MGALTASDALKSTFEPGASWVTPLIAKRKFRVTLHSGVHPCRRITETLAYVISPGSQFLLCCRRFSQLPPGMPPALLGQQFGEFPPEAIPQPRPDKMKNLVHNDQAQRPCISKQLGLEHDTAFADEAGCVHGRPTVRTRLQLAAMSREARLRRN